MTTLPPVPTPAFSTDPPPPTWFSKNWKWFVPVIVLATAVLFAAFVAIIFAAVNAMFSQLFPVSAGHPACDQLICGCRRDRSAFSRGMANFRKSKLPESRRKRRYEYSDIRGARPRPYRSLGEEARRGMDVRNFRSRDRREGPYPPVTSGS